MEGVYSEEEKHLQTTKKHWKLSIVFFHPLCFDVTEASSLHAWWILAE